MLDCHCLRFANMRSTCGTIAVAVARFRYIAHVCSWNKVVSRAPLAKIGKSVSCALSAGALSSSEARDTTALRVPWSGHVLEAMTSSSPRLKSANATSSRASLTLTVVLRRSRPGGI